jgi:hypothetical protein
MGAEPDTPQEQWWPSSVEDVFAVVSPGRRQKYSRYLELISMVLRDDVSWLSIPEGRQVYTTARSWALDGRWDQLLVLLALTGRTNDWPEVSRRWGADPFNDYGLPRAGLFSIVSLRQASAYRYFADPMATPFPVRRCFVRALAWREEIVHFAKRA